MTMLVPAPLQLRSTRVVADWVDYDDNLSEWAYLLIFGENADAFFRFIGVDDDHRGAGHSLFTAETHLRHLREVKLGQRLRLTLQLLGHDSKRLHVLHEMFVPGVGCAATAEQMLVHVRTGSARVEPFGRPISDRVREIAVAHERLLVPDFVGRPIRPPVEYDLAGVPACSGRYAAHLRSRTRAGEDVAPVSTFTRRASRSWRPS
jgi:acyl-CoA thioester hydrolase